MKKKYKRNAKQYAKFRAGFKVWWKKYKAVTFYAETDKNGISLYDLNHRYITEFIAPDYVPYMKYILRNYV